MFHIARYVCSLTSLACGLSAVSLTGTVYDPSGGVVPGATVVLAGAQGDSQNAVTSEAGRFTFQAAPGAYRLEVRQPGFALHQTSVRLESDRVMPVFLRLGMVSESLEIAASGTPQAGPPRAVRVGGNVQPARLLKMPKPAYPTAARERGVHGMVALYCVILKDGTVGSLTPALDADPLLIEAAAAAVRNWRYQPAALNGQPVETQALVTLSFKLQ